MRKIRIYYDLLKTRKSYIHEFINILYHFPIYFLSSFYIILHHFLGQSYILNGEIPYGESKPWTDFNLLYPLPSCVSIMNYQHNSPSPPLQRKYRGRFGEKCLYGNNLAYYQWGSSFGDTSSFSTGFYSPIQSLPGRNRVTVIILKRIAW